MESGKKRIRIDYAPLTVAVSILNITPNCPVVQTFNGFTNQYEPNREITPTVILPQVVASASDGSWGDPHSNHALADMKWFVDGEDISTLSDWENLYEINQNGSLRGAIHIKRNLPPGKQVSLHFEGVLADNRLGVNIPIKTEPIVLSTSDKSQNMYSLSIGTDENIQYNPFKDRLFLYEYKVAQGLMSESATTRKKANTPNSYECKIPIHVFCGDEEMKTGYSVKLFRVSAGLGGAASLTELTTDDDEVDEISPSAIILDLRLVQKSDYMIKAYAENNREVAQIQISISRANPKYTVRYSNGTDISPFDTQRYDEVMVDNDGNVVECPGSIIKFIWKCDSANKKNVELNEGDRTQFLLSVTGIGNSYNDSWIELWVDSGLKDAHKVATDEEGNEYVNEKGETIIFN